MTERITQSMLDFAIERLNENSKCVYVQNNAYGWSQLALGMPNSGGCINTLSNGNSKKELYYQITFLLDWLRYEKNQKNHKASCKHIDDFNRFEGKQNRSVSSEYNGKYYCSGCRSYITKEEYEESIKPRSIDECREMTNIIEVLS